MITSAAFSPEVAPEDAVACLESVPLDRNRSVAFIEYVKPFLRLQSTLAYLKNPPKEYTLPGVDILGGLDLIKRNVMSGNYRGQWAFEKDVKALVEIMPKDFHITLQGLLPLGNVFTFKRSLQLVSVSSDGLSLPMVYVKCKYLDLLIVELY